MIIYPLDTSCTVTATIGIMAQETTNERVVVLRVVVSLSLIHI